VGDPSIEAVPRFATLRRPERETRGPRIEAASLLISRSKFLPWQRMVSDVANEYELVQGENGLEIRLCYEIVVLVVPRQNGKTTLLEPTLVSAALRRPDVDVIYTAQDRQMSKRRLIDELADKRLARRPELAGQFKVRRSNGSEGIRWPNQSLISTVANTDEAGHGLTLDLVCLDEAFSHDDLTVVTALDATMITRPDPQLWIVSTVGDGSDGLLQHYQELGELSLSDPDTRIAYFEWSATDDQDRDDPETWASVMPALGYTITLDRVRDRRRNLTPDVFDRSYLCRRPTFGSTAKLSPAGWASCASPVELSPAGPYLMTFDVSADRQSVAVAVAGIFQGRTAVVTRVLSGSPTAVAREILGIYHGLGVGCRVVADRRAGAGGLIDALLLLGLPVDELTTTELVTSCGTLFDLVESGDLWHDSQPLLDAAAISALARPLGDAWAWDRRKSPTDISTLIAATNAVGLHRSTFGVDGISGGIY
jgi:hypothetical protein